MSKGHNFQIISPNNVDIPPSKRVWAELTDLLPKKQNIKRGGEVALQWGNWTDMTSAR